MGQCRCWSGLQATRILQIQYGLLEVPISDLLLINIVDAVARSNAFYGQGSGLINIDDPGCTGSELRLIDCPFSPIHNCAHSEDAGVDCNLISTLISVLRDTIVHHFALPY